MRKHADLEELLDKLPSKYAITMAVAQRAKQLEGGARHFLEQADDYTPVTAAIEEIRRGKVRIEIAPEDEEPEEALPPIEPREGEEADSEAKTPTSQSEDEET